jgi:hypothetical protein
VKRLFLLILCIGAGMALFSGPVYADPPDPNAQCPSSGCLASDPSDLDVPNVTASQVATGVINTLSMVAGVLSVIFLVLGGIRYITSSGNAQRVESAKQTLIYAVIGLMLSVLAPVIVGFVIAKSP